jgi:hypothetical protein
MSQPVFDPVSDQEPCAQETGFAIPSCYNASEILFHNPAAGRGDKTAIYGAAGNAATVGVD